MWKAKQEAALGEVEAQLRLSREDKCKMPLILVALLMLAARLTWNHNGVNSTDFAQSNSVDF